MDEKKQEFLMEKARDKILNIHLDVIHRVCVIADKFGLDRDEAMTEYVNFASFCSEISTLKKFDLNTVPKASRIRAMTDEELAGMLISYSDGYNKGWCSTISTRYYASKEDAIKNVIKFLQTESEG